MNEGFVNLNMQNFDPNALANQTSTVIMFGVVVDVSPSINSYVHVMNDAAREVFMKELKNSHRKNDIVIKCVKFCERVEHVSGFTPILNLPDDYLDSAPTGGGTALYQAVQETLENVVKYRQDLEDQGIEVRTNIFIITDGEDNSSSRGADKRVKAIVEDLKRNEAWANSFTINMLGVGNAANFEAACVAMGLDPTKCLVTVGASGSEIRKQMGVVSQSVSSSSQQAVVNF
jgi:uncharacterized protein YegL